METRDGVRLDADVYYPDADGEFPVLLMRQPYGRAIASTVVYAHPSWYAVQGYIVVIQDVCGRGSSEGEFSLFANEIADGYDTVEWAAQLPQSTGQVGMYGFSYQGMTQLYAAAAHPPSLKTICPSMAAYDLYADWAYEGGAFCYQANLSWACQLAAETARRNKDADAYRLLYAAARNPNIADPFNPHSELLEKVAPDSFYHDWLANPESSADYWAQLSPKTHLQEVDLPMLHIGGWFDPYLRGTLRLYRAMSTRSQFAQHLWVGPWAHIPWGRRAGAIDYGAEANSPIDRLQIRWFNHFLKGIDSGLLDELPVSLFEMGSNQWRRFKAFPEGNRRTYFLASTGLACMSDSEGLLVESPTHVVALSGKPAADRLPNPHPTDTFVHDPWRPVPYISGHAAAPAGSGDRAALDSRTDVLTYTTAPLLEDLHLAGTIAAEVYCTADALSFDLHAVLSEVQPDGRVFNFAQGHLRMPARPTPYAPTPTPQTITLQPTCIRISAGSALRLSLSAACAPAYAVNTGTGLQPFESGLLEARVITVSVYSGSTFPSKVQLGLIE